MKTRSQTLGEKTTDMPPKMVKKTTLNEFEGLSLDEYYDTMAPRTITQSECDRMTTEAQARIDGLFKGICSKLPSELRLKVLEAYLYSLEMAMLTMGPGEVSLRMPYILPIRRSVQPDGSIDFAEMCLAMGRIIMRRVKDLASIASVVNESPAQVQAVLAEMEVECAKMLPKHTIHEFNATFPTKAQPTRTPVPRKLRHCVDQIFHINLKITLQQTFQAFYPVDLYAAINDIAQMKQHFPSLVSLRVSLFDHGNGHTSPGSLRSLLRSGYMSPNCKDRYTTIEEEMEKLVTEMQKIPETERVIVYSESVEVQRARRERKALQNAASNKSAVLPGVKKGKGNKLTSAEIVDRAMYDMDLEVEF